MSVPAPHFLLFSESRLKRKDVELETETDSEPVVGHWRFVLESLDGEEKLEADDEEEVAVSLREMQRPSSRSERATLGDRLELLAVVRGLEALDQPSRVTLVTPSRYVSRGLRFGLEQWRESGWLWERFGRMAPVKNHDLWQRVDRALTFHQVECRTWQMDEGEDDLAESSSRLPGEAPPMETPSNSTTTTNLPRANWASGLPSFCRRLVNKLRSALAGTSTRYEHAQTCLAGPHFQA